MNPVGVIDLLSFLTILVAVIILWNGWKCALRRDIKLLFAGLLIFILSYNLCLFLEWSGITKALDTLEDFIGTLVLMLWAFVLYAFLQEMTVRDLHQSAEHLRVEVIERKRAEQLIQDARTYAESIVETMREPLLVLDANLRVISANRSFYRTFGVAAEEAKGQFIYELGNRYWDIPKLRELLEEILPKNTSFENFEVEYDLPTIGRRAMLLNARRIYREGNKTQMILLAIEDITERKRAEEALRESKQRLELALRGADLGLWDWNVQTGELIFDQRWANMLGYSLEEIEPHIRTWKKFVHPDDMPGVMEVLNAHLAGKTPFYETEYRLLTKSGEWKWILGRGRLLEWDKDGKPLRVAGTHLDITERKKVEKMQRLVQLGKLVANIAHEVNNPLMIISGRAQFSLMEEVESEEIKKNLQIIFEQTQRAKDIIQRSLRFSKPTKGELKQVDINRSIEEVTGIIEHQFKLGGVKIKRNYAQNLPFVSIDEKQIQEVFMNILTNAYDAISGEGIIEITISCEKDFLRIDFKDTGKGMSKEIIDKIFDPFFTTKEKGTGLGLSVCYGIIKAHNGELKFQSLPGQGTTATILLPIKETKHNVYDFSSG